MEDCGCTKLENQLCFPLYACAKEIVRQYKLPLDRLDLTYTQFIAMLVLWEKEQVNVKELGRFLYLDSGTLTPLLKKLEKKGFIERRRDQQDERSLRVYLTPEGEAVCKKASQIPKEIGACVPLDEEEKKTLHHLLEKILAGLRA